MGAAWVLNGSLPIRAPGKDGMEVPEEDPLWENLKTLWPRFPLPTRQALVTLVQQTPVGYLRTFVTKYASRRG